MRAGLGTVAERGDDLHQSGRRGEARRAPEVHLLRQPDTERVVAHRSAGCVEARAGGYLLSVIAPGLRNAWGTAVGDRHRPRQRLLIFVDVRVLLAIFVIAIAFALYRRRWRLATAIVVTPIVAVVVERFLKRVFQRRYDGALAYPSGHTTLLVVLLGLAVVAVGVAAWTVAIAVVFGLLGALGLSVTFHYFTDTLGGLLLGTALVCLAVRAAGLDRCQPNCDPGHSSG